MLSHRGGSEVVMKKLLIKSVLFLTLILSLFLVSACAKKEDGIKNTIEGSRKTYYEMTDALLSVRSIHISIVWKFPAEYRMPQKTVLLYILATKKI